MKKLLNTLYVMSENGYLGLDGETIAVSYTHLTLPTNREV